MNYLKIALLLLTTITFAQEKISDTTSLQTKTVDTLTTETVSLDKVVDTLNIGNNHDLTIVSD